MADRFNGHSSALHSPASHGFATTPHDTDPLGETTRALFIGGAGAVCVVMASGAELIFAGLAAGTVLPVRAIRVKATGTTASAILGLL